MPQRVLQQSDPPLVDVRVMNTTVVVSWACDQQMHRVRYLDCTYGLGPIPELSCRAQKRHVSYVEASYCKRVEAYSSLEVRGRRNASLDTLQQNRAFYVKNSSGIVAVAPKRKATQSSHHLRPYICVRCHLVQNRLSPLVISSSLQPLVVWQWGRLVA